MSMQFTIGRIILACIGLGLIFIFFLLLFPYQQLGFERSVMWLDLGVVSIVYLSWVLNASIAPVRKDDPAQRGIGGLGIRLYGSLIYTILALGFIFLTIILSAGDTIVEFKWQIMVQAIILFLFLGWLFSSGLASHKTAEVYEAEQEKKAGKADIKYAINNVLEMAEDNGAPDYIVQRLREINGETRFISPSSSAMAMGADNKIVRECDNLRVALLDPQMNAQEIQQRVEQLDRNLRRRKEIRN